MIQELLPYIAGALQWARAQQRFSEIWFASIVVVASFGFYALANPNTFYSVPWNEIVEGWWAQAVKILATVQALSTGSNIVVQMRGGKNSKILPVTDSQT